MPKIAEIREAILRYRADAETFSRLSREYAAKADKSRYNLAAMTDALIGMTTPDVVEELVDYDASTAQIMDQTFKGPDGRFFTIIVPDGKGTKIDVKNLKPEDFGELKTSEEGYRDLAERKDIETGKYGMVIVTPEGQERIRERIGINSEPPSRTIEVVDVATGLPPTDEKMAEAIGISVEELRANMKDDIRYFSEKGKHVWSTRPQGKPGVRCMKCFRSATEPHQNEPCEAGDAPVDPKLNVGVDPLEPIKIIRSLGVSDGRVICSNCYDSTDSSDQESRVFDKVVAMCGRCLGYGFTPKPPAAVFPDECENNDGCACHIPKTGIEFADWIILKPDALIRHMDAFGKRNHLPSRFAHWPDDMIDPAYKQAMHWLKENEPATEPA